VIGFEMSSRPGDDVVVVRADHDHLDVDALFRTQYRPMVRLAVLLVDDLAAAEDVVQDSFVAMQRNGRAPVEPDAAMAYLRTTVVNRCRSVLRHRYVVARFRRRPHAVTDVVDPTLAVDEDSAMLDALRTLPQRQREVLVLRFWADLTHAEIATVLGIAEGSAKSAASRGIAALRTHLEGR
jgi:RNA polymerase sigma-70 factor (sigma-E family)